MKTYREHEKLKALGSRRDEVQSFLDWMGDEQGYIIAEYSGESYLADRLISVRASRQQIMALYFGINLDKLESEKRAMLAVARSAQETRV